MHATPTPAATGPVRRLLETARERPARLAPGRLPPALRIVAVACWVAAAAMLALAFLPGLFTKTEHSIYGGALVFGYSPIWPLLCGIALGSGCAATAFVYLATRPESARHTAALAWSAAVAVPAVPVLLLAIDRSWLMLPTGAAWLAGTAITVIALHVRRQPPAPWLGVLLASLVAVPWVPAVVANLRLGLALRADPLPSDSELLHLLVPDLSAAAYVPGLAAAFVAAMTSVGVALAARDRAAAVEAVRTTRRGWAVAGAVCAAAVVVVALEVSGWAGISSGFIEKFWALDDPWAWPHAVAVAATIALVVQRSFRAPLSSRGDVAATVAVGLGVLSIPITLAVVLLANLVVAAVRGPEAAFIGSPPGLELLIMWVALGCLVPLATARRMRGTVGTAVARVGLLYLVPVYVGITAAQIGAPIPVAFWASPAQVVCCLIVICCLATVSGALGGPAPLPPDAVVRLVAIPLLIITFTSWVPSTIAVPMTPVVAAGAALFTLLWAMPPVAAQRYEHSGVVLSATAQLLLVGACAVIVLRLPDVTVDDPTLAVLLMSIPLSTLLCARVSPAEPQDPAPVSPK